MSFPRNTWYVAAKSDELGEKPLARTICGEKMVLFRDEQSSVAAVDDFCPHRGAPLSLGRVCSGKLVCGYHGLELDRGGTVVAMPGQRVRGFPKVRTFSAVERHGFVWVWPGDAAAANPAMVPHLAWAENPEWAYGGGVYRIDSEYRLMIDNLMDLTHETYVHASSIGQREIDETPCTTKVDGDTVTTSRFMHNIIAPPFLQMALRSIGLPDDRPVDRWQICHFHPPSHVMIEVGVALAGRGGYLANKEDKVSMIVVDFITPETETSHWYFWGMARHFKPEDADLTEVIRSGQGRIFAEDKEMLESQQFNISHRPGQKLLMLNIDAGGVQSRKILDRVMAAERATQPVA